MELVDRVGVAKVQHHPERRLEVHVSPRPLHRRPVDQVHDWLPGCVEQEVVDEQ